MKSLVIPHLLVATALMAAESTLNAQPFQRNKSPISIPLDDLVTKATADHTSDVIGITSTTDGATLHTGFQKLAGTVTSEGLLIYSTQAEGGGLQVKASAIGRAESLCPRSPDMRSTLPAAGNVSATRSLVRFARPGLTEEYSVSVDGVRQDFIVAAAPRGSGSLSVELTLTGASAEAVDEGARLTLAGGARVLDYARLRVTDAEGRALAAKLVVRSPTRMAVLVQDADAVYPIRIDPTFSDSNWVSLSSGMPGANADVLAVAVDGQGNLYVGGNFSFIGSIAASGLAKWDGSTWSALGSGVKGYVHSLLVSGGDLYVGGSFSSAGGVAANNIAKWNGSAWTAFGSGIDNRVSALVMIGSDLYAGGEFTKAGGVPANNIAKWNGSVWTNLGSGTNDGITALAVSGSNLYAGGHFTAAGAHTGQAGAYHVAKWNGSDWSTLGSGTGDTVYALAVSGGDLFVGGSFGSAGSAAANNIAKWNGSVWSAVGTGTAGGVRVLAVSGNDLYAGGSFSMVGGNHIAKWDGSSWSALGTAIDSSVITLAVSGNDLYVGGSFTRAGGSAALRIAQWNGSAWSALGTGFNDFVDALAVSGDDLYVGGGFITSGGTATNKIAKWDGSAWSALGTGMNDYVAALAVNGSDLYAGGYFSMAGGTMANHIAKWNGSTWLALGTGMDFSVLALAVSGNEIYAGGGFTTAGGIPAKGIAKWDGSAWSALGSGWNGTIHALAVKGNDLYAAGQFTTDGGAPSNYIAKWNGSTWSGLGTGPIGTVYALAINGDDLYAGGAAFVAKWDGSTWSALGTGVNGAVRALAVSGSDLYVGGDFTTAGGNVAYHIAKWNGSEWWVGKGMDNTVMALAAMGTGRLFVGGRFALAGPVASPFVVRANLPPPPTIAVSGNGVDIPNDEPFPNISFGTDFGAVQVSNRQATHRFTIRNLGTSPVNLTSTPKVQLSGPAAADFALTAIPSSPLAVGSSTTFEITFDPTLPGLRDATVSIGNDSNTPGFNFAVSGFGALPVLRSQTISFTPPPTHYLYPYTLPLIATASSGLPVTLSLVSGPASLFGNSLTINGTGTVKILATQIGGNNFAPATPVTAGILIKPDPTVLTLFNMTSVYSGTPRSITVYGANPVVTYKVGASYSSTPPTNVGSYPVKVVDFDVTKTGTLVITKAVLTVTAEDKRRFAGRANPALTYRVTGYQGTDNASVITKAPALTTSATLTSAGGLYPITASGAAALNYSFNYQPGTLVVESFAGSYEALLTEATVPVGKLSINVTSATAFTGKLYTATEAAPLPLSGMLATDTINGRASGAATTIAKEGTPYVISFSLPLSAAENMTANVTRDNAPLGSAATGRKLSTATVNYAGAHTAVLGPATPAGASVPAGAGWATATISSTGVLTLTGKLGDDTVFTAALSPDTLSDPGYRLFAQPYLAVRAQSFIAGGFALVAHPTLTNRRNLAASTLTWQKFGLATDASYRAGFGPVSTVLVIDPWQAPKITASTVTLAQRLGLTGNSFGVSHSDTGSTSNGNLPTRLNLSATSIVSVQIPAANLTKWKTLTFSSTTGTFTGSFELTDAAIKRVVNFSGVLRQPATAPETVIGDGNYVLPPLTGTEKRAGGVMFTRP